MIEILIGFLLLGSFSAGYSLLRVGYPKIQNQNAITKIAAGYTVGLILFGIPIFITQSQAWKEDALISLSVFAYWALFFILLVKRFSFRDTDPLIQPKSVERHGKYYKDKEIKEEELNQDLPEDAPKKITFEQGLLVKAKGGKEKQVFKGENNNTQGDSKEEALKKLRESAQGIKKAKKEEDDEVDEDLLNNLGEEE